MTTQHAPGTDIAVTRIGAVVQVTCRGSIDPDQLDWLRHVLVDLIEAQGNLALDVDFPDVGAVDLELLEVLLNAQGRLEARAGHLTVTTRIGFWSAPSTR